LITLADPALEGRAHEGPHKVYYGNSGTEAVEAAIKLARYHTKA